MVFSAGFSLCQRPILTPAGSARLLDKTDQLTSVHVVSSLAKALKTQRRVGPRFLALSRLDYHETVCHTRGSRNHHVVVLLDELGYLPIDKRGADLLFRVVAARYEVGSIVITTNRPVREWGKTLDVDNTLATALIDRLMHHGEGIIIQGDSYRMKDKAPDSTGE